MSLVPMVVEPPRPPVERRERPRAAVCPPRQAAQLHGREPEEQEPDRQSPLRRARHRADHPVPADRGERGAEGAQANEHVQDTRGDQQLSGIVINLTHGYALSPTMTM